jgi:hypothetical protein
MKGYRDIEAQVTSTIEFALGLPLISEQDHRTIKAADDLAAIIEHINLRHNRLFVPDDVRAAVECGFVRTSEADLMALVGRAWRGIVEDEPKQVYKDFLKRDADFRDPKLLQGALVCPKCGQKALKVDAGFLCTSESCVHCGYGNSDMGFSL